MRLFVGGVCCGCCGVWLFVFVFVCLVFLFLFVLFYELSHSLLLHTQVVESFLVSVEGHWTCALTYVLLRRVSLRLLNLDCRYPRDLLQPARKKKAPCACPSSIIKMTPCGALQ